MLRLISEAIIAHKGGAKVEFWGLEATSLRAIMGLVLLLIFALLESLYPRRARNTPRRRRWPGHAVLQLLNAAAVRWLLPWFTPAAVAIFTAQQQWGLLHLIEIPSWTEWLLCLLIMDLVIYWQHRLFHRVPVLWRLHRLHHTDIDLDVTSALRFHPLEILVSELIKAAVVLLFGFTLESLVVFALLLNGMALFNHANWRLPQRLDAALRWLWVTPDMHRVHHSVIRREQDSNFGFNFSGWDRLFGTYCSAPRAGHEAMELGLDETKGQDTGSLPWMLKQPFVGKSQSRQGTIDGFDNK